MGVVGHGRWTIRRWEREGAPWWFGSAARSVALACSWTRCRRAEPPVWPGVQGQAAPRRGGAARSGGWAPVAPPLRRDRLQDRRAAHAVPGPGAGQLQGRHHSGGAESLPLAFALVRSGRVVLLPCPFPRPVFFACPRDLPKQSGGAWSVAARRRCRSAPLWCGSCWSRCWTRTRGSRSSSPSALCERARQRQQQGRWASGLLAGTWELRVGTA